MSTDNASPRRPSTTQAVRDERHQWTVPESSHLPTTLTSTRLYQDYDRLSQDIIRDNKELQKLIDTLDTEKRTIQKERDTLTQQVVRLNDDMKRLKHNHEEKVAALLSQMPAEQLTNVESTLDPSHSTSTPAQQHLVQYFQKRASEHALRAEELQRLRAENELLMNTNAALENGVREANTKPDQHLEIDHLETAAKQSRNQLSTNARHIEQLQQDKQSLQASITAQQTLAAQEKVSAKSKEEEMVALRRLRVRFLFFLPLLWEHANIMHPGLNHQQRTLAKHAHLYLNKLFFRLDRILHSSPLRQVLANLEHAGEVDKWWTLQPPWNGRITKDLREHVTPKTNDPKWYRDVEKIKRGVEEEEDDVVKGWFERQEGFQELGEGEGWKAKGEDDVS